jgi:hypothetical protein
MAHQSRGSPAAGSTRHQHHHCSKEHQGRWVSTGQEWQRTCWHAAEGGACLAECELQDRHVDLLTMLAKQCWHSCGRQFSSCKMYCTGTGRSTQLTTAGRHAGGARPQAQVPGA